MDEVFSKLAVTGATFVGKAAWSYAASLALKKISKVVQEKREEDVGINDEMFAKFEKLEARLNTKLMVVNPIIDSFELQAAQGNEGLSNLLAITSKFKQKLDAFGASVQKHSSVNDLMEMEDLISELDDLIPLLQLQMSHQPHENSVTKAISNISVTRLLQASTYLTMTAEREEKSNVVFDVRLYSLFQGSARKDNIDWTWKEEFSRSSVTIKKSAGRSIAYYLIFDESFDDNRFHDGNPLQKKYSINEIERMFYTSSGSLLNIQESTMPVLVIKVRVEDKIEWLALELYGDSFDDSSSSDDEDSVVVETVAKLTLDPQTPIKKIDYSTAVLEKPKPNLGHLCLLEYILRLCSLEIKHGKSHCFVNDDILQQYFANTASNNSLPEASKINKSTAPLVESPLAHRAPSLIQRFLNG